MKVAVAVSGGADSMCLTFLLNTFCKSHNIDLTAITVDHKLRQESTKEASDVSLCINSHNIKHVVLTWEHGQDIHTNIQEKARESRYELLCEYCQENKITHLFVAHNQDEQAETVMLNILRGSGIDGISGINSVSKRDGVNIIRPLLSFKKSQIINFLKAEKIVWFDDPSNLNAKFDRIKIRQLLKEFDYNGHLINRLNLLAENARRAKHFLNSHTNNTFEKYCIKGEFGYISMKLDDFLTQEEEIKLRLVNKIIQYIHNDPFLKPLRLDSLKLFLKTQKNHTLSKCRIIFHKGVMYFYKEPKFIEPQKQLLRGLNIWDGRYQIDIKEDGYYVTRLTKEIWSKIKPEKYAHEMPSEIIFSTPVIVSPDQKHYHWPFLKPKLDSENKFSIVCSSIKTTDKR